MTKSWLALTAVASLLGAMMVVACGSDDSEETNAAGAGGTAGKGGSAGKAGASGKAGSAGETQQGGSAGTAGSAGGGEPTMKLGAKCKADTDCSEGLICALPSATDWMGGGPAHGYCTKDCTQDGDDACTALDPNAFCIGLGEEAGAKAYCLQGCTVGGTDSEDGFDSKKCWGRADVACYPFSSGSTEIWGCWPLCGDDTDCPSGVPCDREWGMCNPSYKGGLPLGSNCTEWNDSEGDAGAKCMGFCTDWTKTDEAGADDPDNQVNICLETCVVGDPNACGIEDSLGLCLWVSDSAANYGDLGFCGQMCSTDADCLDKKDNVFCDTETFGEYGIGFCDWEYGKGPDTDGGTPDATPDAVEPDVVETDVVQTDAVETDVVQTDVVVDDVVQTDAAAD
ncbi:MAG TPA: hypothetical protein PLI95_18400 [Polyangiaceae bacterium]|nr:hypothetical protein [Polyangiaceae bacterium]